MARSMAFITPSHVVDANLIEARLRMSTSRTDRLKGRNEWSEYRSVLKARQQKNGLPACSFTSIRSVGSLSLSSPTHLAPMNAVATFMKHVRWGRVGPHPTYLTHLTFVTGAGAPPSAFLRRASSRISSSSARHGRRRPLPDLPD